MFVSHGYLHVLLLLSATTTSATTISATQAYDEPEPVVPSSFEEYMVVAVEGTLSSTTGSSSFMTDKELHILEELLMLSYNELVHCPSDLEKDGVSVMLVYNVDAIGFVQAKENVWNKSHHVESFFTFVTYGTCTNCEHQDWLFDGASSNEKSKPSIQMCQCSRPNEKDFVALMNAVFAQATGRSSRIVGVSPFLLEEE
jgi:hypothetical protein